MFSKINAGAILLVVFVLSITVLSIDQLFEDHISFRKNYKYLKDSGYSFQSILLYSLNVILFLGGVIPFLYFISRLPNFLFSFLLSSNEATTIFDSNKLLNLRAKLFDEDDDAKLAVLREKITELESNLFAQRDDGILYDSDKVDWREGFSIIRRRLLKETERLQARSRVNLLFGMLITLFTIVFIIVILFYARSQYNDMSSVDIIVALAPQISLILILQITAAFFFRMYVSNENDIKQNKNEISNVEYRLISALLVKDNKSALARISTYLAKEERNFVLKKGETTAGHAWRVEIGELKSSLEGLLSKAPETDKSGK